MGRKLLISRILILFVFGSILFVSSDALSLRSTTYWTGGGGSGPTNNYWSVSSNWSNGPPSYRDRVIFDDTNLTASSSSWNDNPEIRVEELIFTGNSGYSSVVDGYGIWITNSITARGDSFGVIESYIDFPFVGRVKSGNSAWLLFDSFLDHGGRSMYISTYGNSIQYYTDSIYGQGNVVVSGSTGLAYFGVDAVADGKVYVRNKGYLMSKADINNKLIVRGTGSIHPDSCIDVEDLHINHGGTLWASIGGNSSCSQYGRITAKKSYDNARVDISGGRLTVDLVDGYRPRVGEKFYIVMNDYTEPVSGVFKNRPEGKIFTVDGLRFQITYRGGNGNDIVLTRV